MSADVVPSGAVKPVMTSMKLAQMIQLVKDNQLVTALILFVLWQADAFSQAQTVVGGCI